MSVAAYFALRDQLLAADSAGVDDETYEILCEKLLDFYDDLSVEDRLEVNARLHEMLDK